MLRLFGLRTSVEKHSSSSSSSSSTRMVRGLHRFTLENYSLCKGIGGGRSIDSDSFTVGGHEWVVCFFPDGIKEQSNGYEMEFLPVGLCLRLLSDTVDGVRCLFQLSLIDQTGKGNHRSSRNSLDNVPSGGPRLLTKGRRVGFGAFIERHQLESSCYLKDDCLKIECLVGVVLPPQNNMVMKSPSVVVGGLKYCDDIGADFLAMLESGKGSDFVFDVGGEKIRAHKGILSARSPVFESMFAGDDDHQEMVITSIEPRVFKALLHFIYSDTLPKDVTSLVVSGYAFGPSVSNAFGAKLLAAANEYEVDRLKSICESHIWRSMTLSRFSETLLLADRCHASVLKYMCFKYATDNYADLVELDNFSYIRSNCPLLLKEMDDYVAKERS